MTKKPIIVVLTVLLAGVYGIYFLLPYFISKDAIKGQLVSSFKELTGANLEIVGDITVEHFPSPHIAIHSLYVRNAPGGTVPLLFTIKTVKVWPRYISFFSNKAPISTIILDDVSIELERLKNGQMNWEDKNVKTKPAADLAKVSQIIMTGFTGTRVMLTNGYLRYTDDRLENSIEYKNINLELLSGSSASETKATLSLQYKDKTFTVSGKTKNLQQALAESGVPASITVSSNKSNLDYEGNAGFRNGKFIATGNIKYATDDVVSWINMFSGDMETQPPAAGNYKPLPLTAISDITCEDGKITLPGLSLGGGVIKGETQVEITLPYKVKMKAIIHSLDLETLLASRLFAYQKQSEPAYDAKTIDATASTKSPANLFNLTGDFTLEDITYNQQHITNSHVGVDVSDGEMDIPQFSATLPGKTRLIFTGIGKESLHGFALEGEVDASGEDFMEAIKVIGVNDSPIPANDFKQFLLKANAVISSHDLRLSEISVRVNDMAFAGGLVATRGDHLNIDAALRVGGLNLDHFAEIWGINAWQASLANANGLTARYESFLERWLKQLDSVLKMNISLEGFTLNGVQRDKADFHLEAGGGRVSFNDFKTEYNGSRLLGSLMLDVTGSLPQLDINAQADMMNADTFFTPDGKMPESRPTVALAKASTPRWPSKEFKLHWLEMLNTKFHFRFGQYRQGQLDAQGLDIIGGIKDHALNIDSLTGTVMQAQVKANATIAGGKIPSCSITAHIDSLNPVQLLPFFPALHGMTGIYNINLKLTTGGVDMQSWISDLEGAIDVAGRDIDIHGFNLASVVHSVDYVRTVADILNVIKRAFPKGDTVFSTVQGQWTVTGGVLKTPNATLNNDMATGLMAGQIDLSSWQTETTINLLLKAIDAKNPPSMLVSINGSLDNPDISIDTRSLEQYITNKTSERMLQGYGSQ